MFISYKKKFIFIHIYKVAGSSIRKALGTPIHKTLTGKIINKFNIKKPSSLYKKYRLYPSHTTARELKTELPENIFNNFFKFAFVRNPWDWQVSMFFYVVQWKERDWSYFIGRQFDYNHRHNLFMAMKSFDSFIEWVVKEDKQLQKDFVTDENGNLIVDFIGKYENLKKDFQKVRDTLGINATLPHLVKSDHKNYKSYYNNKTKKLIEEHFKEDIEFFNYSY